jgi:hypothetical protein
MYTSYMLTFYVEIDTIFKIVNSNYKEDDDDKEYIVVEEQTQIAIIVRIGYSQGLP